MDGVDWAELGFSSLDNSANKLVSAHRLEYLVFRGAAYLVFHPPHETNAAI